MCSFFMFQITRYQYPLHRISYCADDKSDRRMLTFIAKASDTNEHFCYVFASEKSVSVSSLTNHFFYLGRPNVVISLLTE